LAARAYAARRPVPRLHRRGDLQAVHAARLGELRAECRQHDLRQLFPAASKAAASIRAGLSTAAPDLNGNGTREAAEIFDYFLFEPEKVDSYEVGYKASLFDRRLRFASPASMPTTRTCRCRVRSAR
jgi:hypothetical protein